MSATLNSPLKLRQQRVAQAGEGAGLDAALGIRSDRRAVASALKCETNPHSGAQDHAI